MMNNQKLCITDYDFGRIYIYKVEEDGKLNTESLHIVEIPEAKGIKSLLIIDENTFLAGHAEGKLTLVEAD